MFGVILQSLCMHTQSIHRFNSNKVKHKTTTVGGLYCQDMMMIFLIHNRHDSQHDVFRSKFKGITGILCDFFHLHTWTDYCLKLILYLTNLFPKYHMSKHYRTHVKCRKMWYKKINKKVKKLTVDVNSLYFKRRLWSN